VAESRPGAFWAAVAAMFVAGVGSLGPWVAAGAFTQDGLDRWYGVATLPLAVVGLIVMMVGATRGRSFSIAALAVSLLILVIGAIGYLDIRNTVEEVLRLGTGPISPAWGIYLVLLGGVVAVVAAVALLDQRRQAVT
jgi:hypothetical protein